MDSALPAVSTADQRVADFAEALGACAVVAARLPSTTPLVDLYIEVVRVLGPCLIQTPEGIAALARLGPAWANWLEVRNAGYL